MIKWQEIFSKDGFHWQDAYTTSGPVAIARLDELKRFLDAVHIRFCLVKPYQEHKSYPLVEGRELLPSFDNDMFEYKDLPGFSMVAFARQLDYFSETFQFDKLHPIVMEADGACCPLENQVLARNVQTLASRLPRMHQDIFRQQFANADTVILDNYPSLMPYLLVMDRAQVLALDADRQFHLAGVFASFPSDIDSELKRFGMRIGKFVYGDSEIYERNRMFVYQYLMELYGFPIVSERRTSSALFARKLHKLGEHFMLRVLGQTDRTITTYTSTGQSTRYPLLEKIALISVDEDQEEALETLEKGGYFLDRDRRVVIIRVTYRQHRFDASNVQQDRALPGDPASAHGRAPVRPEHHQGHLQHVPAPQRHRARRVYRPHRLQAHGNRGEHRYRREAPQIPLCLAHQAPAAHDRLQRRLLLQGQPRAQRLPLLAGQ